MDLNILPPYLGSRILPTPSIPPTYAVVSPRKSYKGQRENWPTYFLSTLCGFFHSSSHKGRKEGNIE